MPRTIFSWLRKEEHLVGIEFAIGCGQGRLVELKTTRNSHLILLNCHKIHVELALARTAHLGPIKGRNTASALPAEQLLFKEQTVSNQLSRKELRAFLSFTIEQLFPKESEWIMDYQLQQDCAQTWKISLVAATKESVVAQERQLSNWHLNSKIVEPDIFAIARAIKQQTPQLKTPILVVKLEERRLVMLRLEQDKILKWRQISLPAPTSLPHDYSTIIPAILDMAPIESVSHLILAGVRSKLETLQQELLLTYPHSPTGTPSIIISDTFRGLDYAPHLKIENIQRLAPEMLTAYGLALRVQHGN